MRLELFSMRNWFEFLSKNRQLLNFGFQFNFFSSFGQTFFISLYVPFLIESIQITNAAFGSLYAGVTVVSAFLISAVGKYIDQISLKKYGLLVFFGLVISVVVLSQARNVLILAAGLFMVRWFGQGLMTHTSTTGIAKLFDAQRGKALGLTALGHPAGQFILPLIVVPLIGLTSWRFSLVAMAALSVVVVLPTIWNITPKIPAKSKPNTSEYIPGKEVNYFRDSKFWIIAANSFLIPFVATALFLYQYPLGQSLGWTRAWVAFSFSFYAIFNALALLVSGSLVDRFSGIRLFPLYLIPTLLSMIVFFFVDDQWTFPLLYAMLGISAGLGSTIKTAVQVEVYGTGELGKIRSYFSTLLVLSTALGPPAFGYFIDRGYSLRAIIAMLALVVLLVLIISFRIKVTKVN